GSAVGGADPALQRANARGACTPRPVGPQKERPMRRLRRLRFQPSALAALLLSLLLAGPTLAQDRLPSWNDGKTKQAILDFVKKVTAKGNAEYVPPAQRIAVFDNDGTLWTEQPIYVQLAFALDRVKALAPQHPEWKDQQPFKAVLDGDMKALAEAGEKGVVEILMATHAGMSTEEFERIVKD